jgi:hypothetical protein
MYSPSEIDRKFIIEPKIGPHRGPIFFVREHEIAIGSVEANGSFGLVDTGKKRLLVTCQHVWDDFKQRRRGDPQLRMRIGLDSNQTVVFSPGRPLGEDRELDIATFDLEPLLAACPERKFYPFDPKTAPRVAKGDRIFFVGYPGAFRCATDKGVQSGSVVYDICVSDVSGPKFLADISKAHIRYELKPKLSEELNPHGGISGSPCFLVQKHVQVRLVAFVTAEWKSSLMFTHANCINQDGTIRTRSA